MQRKWIVILCVLVLVAGGEGVVIGGEKGKKGKTEKKDEDERKKKESKFKEMGVFKKLIGRWKAKREVRGPDGKVTHVINSIVETRYILGGEYIETITESESKGSKSSSRFMAKWDRKKKRYVGWLSEDGADVLLAYAAMPKKNEMINWRMIVRGGKVWSGEKIVFGNKDQYASIIELRDRDDWDLLGRVESVVRRIKEKKGKMSKEMAIFKDWEGEWKTTGVEKDLDGKVTGRASARQHMKYVLGDEAFLIESYVKRDKTKYRLRWIARFNPYLKKYEAFALIDNGLLYRWYAKAPEAGKPFVWDAEDLPGHGKWSTEIVTIVGKNEIRTHTKTRLPNKLPRDTFETAIRIGGGKRKGKLD